MWERWTYIKHSHKPQILKSWYHLPLAEGRGDFPTLLPCRWQHETNWCWTRSFFPSSFVASVPEENCSFYAEIKIAVSPLNQTPWIAALFGAVWRASSRASHVVQHNGYLWFLKSGLNSRLLDINRCACTTSGEKYSKEIQYFLQKHSAFSFHSCILKQLSVTTIKATECLKTTGS